MADTSLVLKISFDLSESDFGYFRDKLQASVKAAGQRDEAALINGAKGLVAGALKASPPDFVRESIAKLDQFIAMLEDKDWKLEGDHRSRILSAIAYFADPNDLIADNTPGIGYLDDAIMIELVARELVDDLKSYKEFVDYRAGADSPERKKELLALREQLHDKLRARYSAMEGRLSGYRSPWRLF